MILEACAGLRALPVQKLYDSFYDTRHYQWKLTSPTQYFLESSAQNIDQSFTFPLSHSSRSCADGVPVAARKLPSVVACKICDKPGKNGLRQPARVLRGEPAHARALGQPARDLHGEPAHVLVM